jgi:hypothetical protein
MRSAFSRYKHSLSTFDGDERESRQGESCFHGTLRFVCYLVRLYTLVRAEQRGPARKTGRDALRIDLFEMVVSIRLGGQGSVVPLDFLFPTLFLLFCAGQLGVESFPIPIRPCCESSLSSYVRILSTPTQSSCVSPTKAGLVTYHAYNTNLFPTPYWKIYIPLPLYLRCSLPDCETASLPDLCVFLCPLAKVKWQETAVTSNHAHAPTSCMAACRTFASHCEASVQVSKSPRVQED